MEQDGADLSADSRGRLFERGWSIGCVGVYLALSIATAAIWEPVHDEGVTWGQAFGVVSIPAYGSAGSEAAGELASVDLESLDRVISADPPHSMAEVIAALLTRGGMHPPAYYLLLNAWSEWFGTARLPLSVPSYVAGVLSLFGIRRLARQLAGGAGAGRLAMAMLAVSPWFVGFSTLARPYSLAVCAAIWSSVAVLAISTPGLRKKLGWRGAFVASSTFGLYCIYHYAFVLAWHAFLLGVYAWRSGPERRRAELTATVAMLGTIGLCFAPWLPKLLFHLDLTGSQAWYFSGAISTDHWLPLAIRALRIYALGESATAIGAPALRGALLVLAVATLPLLLVSLRRPASADLGERGRIFLASAALLPSAVVVADALHGTHTIFFTRQCFFLFPLLLLLVVRAWWMGRRSWRMAAAAWPLLLLSATGLGLATRYASSTAYELVARELAAVDSPAHLVVLSSMKPGYVAPLLLSLRKAGVESLRVAYAPGERVDALVEHALRQDGEARVSLVNLSVLYDRNDVWSSSQLRGVAARASDAGWQVVRFSPGSALGRVDAPDPLPEVVSPATGASALWIISPTPVKHFAMEAMGVTPLQRR